jgi:hypothetical protein
MPSDQSQSPTHPDRVMSPRISGSGGNVSSGRSPIRMATNPPCHAVSVALALPTLASELGLAEPDHLWIGRDLGNSCHLSDADR